MKILRNPKVILLAILAIATILRVYKVDQVPVSLFGDELDLGYQAYSILHTGKDYYGNSWPANFHSLAEYRTPLYLYSAVPTVAFFGISPLGVRLPAVIFGILGVWALYLLVKQLLSREDLALVSAAVLTFSPWHLQYSRAGFEVTELLFFILIGLYLFFKGLKEGKHLWMSVIFLVLTPTIYSTAKLFTPFLLVFLFTIHFKQIIKLPRKYLIYAFVSGFIVGIPVSYSILTTPQRFDYISVFTNPTIQSDIGYVRQMDAKVRGDKGIGLTPTFEDRFFENKFTYVGKEIIDHYLQSLSASFLFSQGDPNLRQSPKDMGEFYKIEAIAMLVGIVLFFGNRNKDQKLKLFILFWVVVGILPASLTRDGGDHATRLILILPPLTILIAYGLVVAYSLLKKRYRTILYTLYTMLFCLCAVMYLHNYYVHYPWESERWWHAGWQEAIQAIKENEANYDKVILSTRGEPPWIFFAAWYEYPPDLWQSNFPIGNDALLPGFDKISHTGKFYFGSPVGKSGLYELGDSLTTDELYLASAAEVNVNLIIEPTRLPGNLKLIKAIAYPSGEPALYLLAKK